MEKVGKDRVITIERVSWNETELEVVEGGRSYHGLIMVADLENPYLRLLTRRFQISKNLAIVESILQSNRPS